MFYLSFWDLRRKGGDSIDVSVADEGDSRDGEEIGS